MRLLILMSIVLILADFGCKDNTIEVIQPRIKLSVEDLGVTDVWLKISIPQNIQRRSVTLIRDNVSIIVRSSILSTDTLIHNGSKLPNQTYTYKLYDTASFNQPNVTSLAVTTMDTTSHDYTWEIDTLGWVQSRIYGLWGSDENNIYAVGYFNSDTGGHKVMAQWDGTGWKYVNPTALWGPYGLQAGELISIYGLNANTIWVVGYGYGSFNTSSDTVWGFIAKWDGSKWENISPNSIGEQFFSVWASSENDVWVGSTIGNIYHYDGTNWSKTSTVVNYSLWDIWGISNEEIYISGRTYDDNDGVVLKYNGQSWEKLIIGNNGTFTPCNSVWGVNSRFLFIATDAGLYTNYYDNNHWTSVVFNGTNSWLRRVRGTAKNNIFIGGYYGTILHYNGYSFRNYRTQFTGSETWAMKAIQVFDNTVFIGGRGGYGFDVHGIVLRGKRL